MPENQKETWEKDLGVNYVALTGDPKLLRSLSQWGSIDINSVPENRRGENFIIMLLCSAGGCANGSSSMFGRRWTTSSDEKNV